MVDFLLKRPIAVLMAYLGIVIVGCITYFTLPVSLLPDIAIPHITVQVSRDNVSARELENVVVTPLRRQLMQVGGLQEIRSVTRDGSAVVNLTMDYGVDTDLAFIEVNEKIDAAMGYMPRDMQRPRAIKASATDIPVLYLNMTLRNDDRDESRDAFLDMCDVAENIVRRRLEQLPQIAMVDMTGVPGRMLSIKPDDELMKAARVTHDDLKNALNANNVEPGSMTVRDGYYEYNIRVDNLLRTVEDVKRIKIRKEGRIFELQDFCDVRYEARNPEGYSLYKGKRAITLAIIKQSEESMASFKKVVEETREYFAGMYTDISFEESRDQTKLLDYAIDNLEQNLILGLILVFIVCALFMKDGRSPLVIGINIVVAIIMTFLIFYLFHVSVNIISLSGLILAVGMMIDNSVIVTENITQYRVRGLTLRNSCIAGTNEMITPMLSSSLTTIAVFVPLVFMSGIAGAIFADQAFSITSGLGASYIVGITLLPVLYYLFHARVARKKGAKPIVAATSDSWLTRGYDRGVDWVFSHKAFCLCATVAMLPLCAVMFSVLRHEKMPEIDSDEVNMVIDWNENIDIEQNRRRSAGIADDVKSMVVEHSAAVGLQDYMLDAANSLSATEAELYFRTADPARVAPLVDSLRAVVVARYPKATIGFGAPENIFEKIFSTDESDMEVRIYSTDRAASPAVGPLLSLRQSIASSIDRQLPEISLRPQINIVVDREKLALYRVGFSEIRNVLNTAFKGEFTSTLRSHQEYVPIAIEGYEQDLYDVLNNTLVKTQPDEEGNVAEIPLSRLIEITRSRDLKNITSNGAGEYVAFGFDCDGREIERITEDVRTTVRNAGNFDVEFGGMLFASEKMIHELIVILIVALLLMYFILCAQFESFLQPLVVLVEIPIDTCFALVTLWACGHTLNLMSAIGIIVTCGIVVNDSILKIDAINSLRKDGVPLLEAIHVAGRRRLRAILMTSLTTIFAMVPLLFTSDMGSELQRPLAIAMIGSMVVGTAVSVFIIPLLYWFIYRKHAKKAV